MLAVSQRVAPLLPESRCSSHSLRVSLEHETGVSLEQADVRALHTSFNTS
jgi:hypothetical protein